MSTPARIVLILLALVVLLVAGLAVFLLTLDPERYRGQIVEQIHESTGLDVRLDGPITWSIWPSIRLGVADAAADWTDAGSTPLIAIKRVEFSAALLPLLSSEPRLVVDNVTLDGVALELHVDENGRGNWLPPDDGSTPAEPAASSAKPDATPADAGQDHVTVQTSATLTLERLEVNDLGIHYLDAASGTDARLEGLDLSATPGRTDDEMNVTVGGHALVVSGPEISFDGHLLVNTRARSLDIDQLGADIRLPDVAEPLRVSLAGRASHDQSSDVLHLDDLQLRIGELTTTLGGTIADLSGAGRLDLKLRIARSDLRAVLARFGALPATSDPQAFTRLSGDIGIGGRFDDVTVQPLTIELDALKLTGSAGLRSSGARPDLRFTLAAGRVDLTPYLPPAASEPAPARTGPLVSEDSLGLDQLQAFDLQGELRADGLTTPTMAIGPTRIELDNRSGRLQARIRAQDLIGGKADLALAVDGSASPPTLDLRIDATDLDAGRLAPDLGFSGPVSLRGTLDATGASSAALSRTLGGRLDLTGSQGTLDVTRLKGGLQAIAGLLGKGEKIAAWPDQLRYRKLTGTWVVTDGLDDQRVNLDVDNLKVDAKGALALDTGNFDFRAGSTFTPTSTGVPRTFDVPSEFDGLRLPMRCKGNLDDTGNPCGFDQDAAGPLIAQVMASKAGDKVRAKLQEKLPEDLRGPAQQLLQGLFGAPPKQQEQQEQKSDQQPRTQAPR